MTEVNEWEIPANFQALVDNWVPSADFNTGWSESFACYEPGEPLVEPTGVSGDYLWGWWVGAADATVWSEGWDAYLNGIRYCPYAVGSEEEYFREYWLIGYADAMKYDESKINEH